MALELFSERGYDKTTLQEVAERLDITRPALYYHFRTKEDILVSVMEVLVTSVEELIAWAQAQPATAEARLEILRRVADLLEDRWRPLMRFAQVNHGVMGDLPMGARMQESVVTMLSVLAVPGAAPVKQFEARLAVFAVILASVPTIFGMDEIPEDQRTAVALEVAAKLISEL
ncbi:helix-turn-helix domain-containing protein [Nonomuraea sp. NPDC005983]|uniref:TetR/AcrR family transcriptional regulator n=1 Tax=Nonomuraea sp. NPDC005983 TaxID=3155595 RepID=UPI00339DBA98